MPPGSIPTLKSHSSKNLEAEEVLQAVVLADSFNERFMPLTLERPRCLLPLAGTPLLEYTLEFLAVAGVQDVFVVCCAHADQVQRYVEQSRWGRALGGARVHCLVADCRNAGDALRELDAKSLIKGDFVLIAGDVVTNMSLERALEMHRLRRQADKSVIMTMVVKQTSTRRRTRCDDEEPVFVLDARNHQCLFYEPQSTFPRRRRLELDVERVLDGHAEVQLRRDLIDCQIDICSPEVPALFTENFDFGDIRVDFVKGILESDLLERKMFCHVLAGEFAARVRSTRMYDAVSRDVLARWAFPVVPENGLHVEGSSRGAMQLSRGNVYRAPGVTLWRSALVGPNVLIGEGTTIGLNSVVKNSVVGRNCVIGSNVTLDGAYLWDNVVVDDDCSVAQAILAGGVRLFERSRVERGCILAYGVSVGPDVKLAPFTKLTRIAPGAARAEARMRRAGGTLGVPGRGRRPSSSFPAAHGGLGSADVTAASSPSGPGRRASSAAVSAAQAAPVGRTARIGSCSSASLSSNVISSASSSSSVSASSADEAGDAADPSAGEYSRALVGERGRGYPWRDEDEDASTDDEGGERTTTTVSGGPAADADAAVVCWNRRAMSIGCSATDVPLDEATQSESDDPDEDDAMLAPESEEEAENLPREVVATIHRAVELGHGADNTVLELNTLKMAFNATFSDLRRSAYPALLDTLDPKGGRTAAEALLRRWRELFRRFTFNEDDQLECLRIIERHVLNRPPDTLLPLFVHVLYFLYDLDIVDEVVILQWYRTGCGAMSAPPAPTAGRHSQSSSVSLVLGASPTAPLVGSGLSQLSAQLAGAAPAPAPGAAPVDPQGLGAPAGASAVSLSLDSVSSSDNLAYHMAELQQELSRSAGGSLMRSTSILSDAERMVRERVAPFINWLQQAEEETDSDGSGDSR